MDVPEYKGELEMIQFAIPVPKELEADIVEAFRNVDTEHSVQTRTFPLEEVDDKDLGFDPISIASAVWVGIKIVGPTAATLTTGVISGLIANELFRRKYSDAKGHTLTIRLPNAATIEVPVDRPFEEDEVIKFLKDVEVSS